MRASQYIFTACGKEKKGDFVTWSKTPDIQPFEEEEIHKMMTYKQPSNLNAYTATPEQIRAACPVKYGYFELSSGKKVLAESVYIGKVYSDHDHRIGNFFIHAYVFDDLGDILPTDVLGTAAFQHELSYAEWHDSPCPDSLPAVEFTAPAHRDLSALSAFLTEDRIAKLPALLQSVLQSVRGGGQTTFNDGEEEQKLWYTALCLLLPKSIRGKMTFCSRQASGGFVSASAVGTSAKEVSVRNLVGGDTPTFGGSAYASPYASPYGGAAQNRPVFEFAKNQIPAISVGKYAVGVCDALRSGVDSALAFVREASERMRKYGVDEEEATTLLWTEQRRFQRFADLDDYVRGLELAERAGVFTKQISALELYDALFVQNVYAVNASSLPLLRNVYAMGDGKVKGSLIRFYLAENARFGVNKNGDPEAYVADFFRNAPFEKRDFSEFLLGTTGFSAGFASRNTFAENYLFFQTFLPSPDRSRVFPVLSEIVARSAQQRSLAELGKLLEKTAAVRPEYVNAFLEGPVLGSASLQTDRAFVFDVMESLTDLPMQVKILKMLIDGNESSASFLQDYIRRANGKSALYKRLEEALAQDKKYESFFFIKETTILNSRPYVSREDLRNYLEKYYKKGYDRGLYRQMLEKFVRSMRSADPVNDLLSLYADVRTVEPTYADMPEILCYLEREIYKAPLSVLLKLPVNTVRMIEELDKKIVRLGRPLDPKTNLVFFGRDINAVSRDPNIASTLCQRAVGGVFYQGLEQPQTLESICENFLPAIVDFYLSMRLQKPPVGTEKIFPNLLLPLSSARAFADALTALVSRMNGKNYALFMTDWFIFAFSAANPNAAGMCAILKKYVQGLNKGTADRLLADMSRSVPDAIRPAVERYAQELKESRPKGGLFGFGAKKPAPQPQQPAQQPQQSAPQPQKPAPQPQQPAQQPQQSAPQPQQPAKEEKKGGFWHNLFGKKDK